MAGHRLERTTEDIKRELTAIFRELKDPRVQQALFAVSFLTVLHSDMFHSLFLRLPTALSTVQTSAEF